MKTVAIIQARMSSTRLAGKVLLPIAGKPMLWYVINRTQQSVSLTSTIVATSTDPSDRPIMEFCKKINIACFRGDLTDVLDRYYRCAQSVKANIIVRITADCPLIDGTLVEEGLKQFTTLQADYLSNTVKRTYPRGFDFEIFTFSSLKKAYLQAQESSEREHVTPYIWKTHPQEFRIEQLILAYDASRFRITVDTPDDLKMVQLLIKKYRADRKTYTEIIKILESHPEIVRINAHIQQKQYGQ